MNSERAWIIASQAPGIGARRFQQFLAALSQHQLQLEDFLSLPSTQQQRLFPFPTLFDRWRDHCVTFDAESVLNDLAKKDARVVSFTSAEYPLLLKEIPDPPAVLFVRGQLNRVNCQPIAVVGARHITGYGERVTQMLTKALVEMQFTIVSGFMYGVDVQAHRSCLAAGGYTVGVLGYGFNYVYPPHQQELMTEVLAKGGAFITEFIPSQNPLPANFPVRNRIVAGLSLGVLVTEAAAKSGSKITAQFAIEYGREVFCVPAPITSDFCEGTKQLMNEGATMVTGIEDILAGLGYSVFSQFQPSAREKVLPATVDLIDQQIIELLAAEDCDPDELVERVGLPIVEVQHRLTSLEIQHLVVLRQGKYGLQ